MLSQQKNGAHVENQTLDDNEYRLLTDWEAKHEGYILPDNLLGRVAFKR